MSTSPVPVIEISLAPQEDPQPEPYSPFTPMNSGFSIAADDPYRPALLTPPAMSWSLSPSHKTPASQKGRGINDEDFQSLLRASKERSSTVGTRRQDLRKEVALKAHKSKQVERRALFLSKIGAPPSPSAVSMPKTPPESPAIFHYSLPSPGLMSPLALFEKLGLDDLGADESAPRKVWVEQVDFRLPKRFEAEPESESESESAAPAPAAIPTITVTSTPAVPDDRRRRGHARKPSLPSLEQITERFTAQAIAAPAASPTLARACAPLPAFLQTRRQSPSPPPEEAPAAMPTQTTEAPRPRLASTGRIRVRSHTPPQPPQPETSKPLPPLPLERSSLAPSRPAPGSPCHRTYELPAAAPASPLTPSSPKPPTLQVTTTHVPRTSSSSPVQLTEANLFALNSRARTARDMLCAVRRRTAVYSRPRSVALASADGEKWVGELDDEKCRRRISAPAELPRRERGGFTHPVLSLDGGF